MRKVNNILVRIIIVLFLLHGFMGSLMLLGFSNVSFSYLSWGLLAVVVIHGILSLLSTLKAVHSGNSSGHWYLKQNAGFWAKRVTGVMILVLLFFHVNAYTTCIDGRYFLKEFTLCKMMVQVLFVLSIFIHLAVSIKSMLIAKGVIKFKERTVDWMLVLSLMMFFFLIAIILYYIEWQM